MTFLTCQSSGLRRSRDPRCQDRTHHGLRVYGWPLIQPKHVRRRSRTTLVFLDVTIHMDLIHATRRRILRACDSPCQTVYGASSPRNRRKALAVYLTHDQSLADLLLLTLLFLTVVQHLRLLPNLYGQRRIFWVPPVAAL